MRLENPQIGRNRRSARFLNFFICAFLLAAPIAWGQQTASPPPATKGSASTIDPAEFARATDEVLKDMSRLLGLPQLEPLKKSLRSRDEIRAYVIRQMKEDKEPEKRHADELMLKKLGLFPKDFQLDSFLVDLLTEQIAGLYDPKTKEFYIADWIPLADQKDVMAHELTHALQDQHYHLEQWHDAAKPNDDAESARDAVMEGGAVASMIDYGLDKKGMRVMDLPKELKLSAAMSGGMDSSPMLKKAPAFLRDDLLFPYAAGVDFALAVLRTRGGWPGFHIVFEDPPVSTQQIMHPELYLNGTKPAVVTLPELTKNLGKGWKKLDENIFGEFGLLEILKQYLDENRAETLAKTWAGDRYAIYQQRDTSEAMLVMRFQVASASAAERLFGGLSESYKKEYGKKLNFILLPTLLSFDSEDGGIFLRCQGAECITMQGGNQNVFDDLVLAIGWPLHPEEKGSSNRSGVAVNVIHLLHDPAAVLFLENRP